MMIGPRPEAVAEAEGKIKTADALVDFSQAHLDYHTIRAPIDGVLDSLHCHPGQTIAVGTPIGEVVDSRQVFASIWLPPRSAASVRVGMAAHVGHGDARDPAPDTSAEEEKEMAGKVAFVGRVADPQTGNLPIRVLVDNPHGRLTIGQSVRVSIIVDERKGVLQVPAEAVLDLGEGPVLNVVRDGKTVVLHPEVKTPHGGWIEVAGTDLKEGEPVIVEGGYNLPEGTPVKLGGEKEEAKDEEPAKPTGEKEHAKDDEPVKAAGEKERAKERRTRQARRREDRGQGGGQEMSLTIGAGNRASRNRRRRDQPGRPGQAVLRADRADHQPADRLRRRLDAAHAQRHLPRGRLPADRRHRPDARPGGQGRRGRRHPADRGGGRHRAGGGARPIEIGARGRRARSSTSPPVPT